MTEADREIIEIVKELFCNKNSKLTDPDDRLQDHIVKQTIYLAILCTVILVPIQIFGDVVHIKGVLSGVVSLAFTFLFFHLNIKSKNPSLILYILTWLSLMLSLWL
jgi:hypothetical protein